jgi:hypothetical protein
MHFKDRADKPICNFGKSPNELSSGFGAGASGSDVPSDREGRWNTVGLFVKSSHRSNRGEPPHIAESVLTESERLFSGSVFLNDLIR